MSPFIVGIRFQKVGKIYHFDASESRELQVGDFAVVDTTRGRQLGEVIQLIEKTGRENELFMLPNTINPYSYLCGLSCNAFSILGNFDTLASQ